MNRAQLRAAVQRQTGLSSTDFDDLIHEGIDLALHDLSSRYPWRGLRNTADVTISAVGDTSVALASNVARMRWARILRTDDAPELRLRSEGLVRRLYEDPSITTQGLPLYGWVSGTTLTFAPAADDTYTIRYGYQAYETSLATDSDSPTLTGVDTAIIAYACFWSFNAREEYEAASQWQAQYEKAFSHARKSEHHFIDIGGPEDLRRESRFRDIDSPFTAITSYDYW